MDQPDGPPPRPTHAADVTGGPGLEERVFQRLLLAADHLLRGELEVLRLVELTFAQYNVLRILRAAHPERLSCTAIAERMISRDSDVTRLLDRLSARAFVVRGRESWDRRVVTAAITDAGLQLLRRLDGPVDRIHRQQLAHLTTEELETLDRLATRVRAAKPPGSPPAAFVPREEQIGGEANEFPSDE